jgi:hypothetical protein
MGDGGGYADDDEQGELAGQGHGDFLTRRHESVTGPIT